MARISVEFTCEAEACGKTLRYMPFVSPEPIKRCFEHSRNESGERVCPNPTCNQVMTKPPFTQCFRCMLDLIGD